MTDNMTDYMYEKESERMWEEQNKDDVNPDMLYDAHRRLRDAGYALNTVCDKLIEAADVVRDTPAEDPIISLLDDIDNISIALDHLKRNFRKGVIS
jgi:hypothetical protein